jgi:hypothetical protein
MKTRMPGICASFGRRPAITSSTVSWRSECGFRSALRRPVFSPALLPPGPWPMVLVKPEIFGSSATIAAASC